MANAASEQQYFGTFCGSVRLCENVIPLLMRMERTRTM
jgi:hypothetical protein